MKIAQCWDDGVVNDIRLTELLRKYHAKATFNLSPGALPPQREACRWIFPGERTWNHLGFHGGHVGQNELTDIYGDFKVASHCFLHEGATNHPLAEFITSAIDARKFLEDRFQRPCPGFAWPGGGYTAAACDALRNAGFAYGRTTENTDDATACADPLALRTNCHFQARNFYARYEAARPTGVFYFWGHSYEMLDCAGLWNQLEDKFRFIADDPEAEWVDVIDLPPLCRAARG